MNRKRFSYFFIVVTERTRAGRTFCETELDALGATVLGCLGTNKGWFETNAYISVTF
jgi:hypothetical protein